jgi:predicted lipoprotein
MIRPLALALICATPATADVASVITNNVLPDFATFDTVSAEMAASAIEDCSVENLRSHYNATFDAWMAVQHLRIGPTENGALNIAFWPDERGFTAKTLSAMIADTDPLINDAEGFAASSIAGRGLFALEMLLFDDRFQSYASDSYTCTYVQRVTADIAREAQAQATDWRDRYALIIQSQGDGETLPFVPEDDAFGVLYTQLISSLDFTTDSRIGRPLADFARPRPTRAEAWHSERSLRNIVLVVDTAYAQATELMGTPLPATSQAVTEFHEAADAITDPSFSDIADDSQSWLKLQILGQRVQAVKNAISNEIGAVRGISAGFNASDGD